MRESFLYWKSGANKILNIASSRCSKLMKNFNALKPVRNSIFRLKTCTLCFSLFLNCAFNIYIDFSLLLLLVKNTRITVSGHFERYLMNLQRFELEIFL